MTTVVIADDSLIMRSSLKKILTKAGYKVIGEVENGLQAIEAYRRLQPDIMTMDINMPMMNGIEASERIVAEYYGARIVIISAVDEREKVLQALEKGARHYLIKPFNEQAVLGVIRVVLGNEDQVDTFKWQEES